MKKLLLFLLFIPSLCKASPGPLYQHKDPEDQREFQNLYDDISPAATATTVFLQSVASTTYTDTDTNSTTFSNTNLSKSITLASTASRVEISVFGCFEADLRGAGGSAYFTIKRGSTDLGIAASGGIVQEGMPGSTLYLVAPGGMAIVDSPSTSGAVTYTVAIRVNSAANTVGFPCNTGVGITGATMILRELPL